MKKLITKSFQRLLDKGIHRGFITHEELSNSLGKRSASQENFEKEDIICKGIIKSYSTPNRLVVYFQNINLEVLKKSEDIRGPSIVAPKEALERIIKSNQIEKKNIFKKKTDKGEFYFFSKHAKKIKTRD